MVQSVMQGYENFVRQGTLRADLEIAKGISYIKTAGEE